MQRLHKQSMDEASPTLFPGASGTRAVYHSRVQHTWEAPGPWAGAKREVGVLLDASNDPSDREKDVGYVGLLVQEWMVQGEEPALGTTAALTPTS